MPWCWTSGAGSSGRCRPRTARVIDELMDEVVRLLDAPARQGAASPPTSAYGTLLGAVRNGELIGHDNDIDIAYVSEHPHPVDVVREGYRVERVLRDEGWVVRRGSGARLNVRLRLQRRVDALRRRLHLALGRRGAVHPVRHRVPAAPRDDPAADARSSSWAARCPRPADPEALLAATYGHNWRVPDPSFKYTTPRWLSRRLGGWFGGLMTHRKHWDAFYSKQRAPGCPTGPVPFARWVDAEYPSTRPLVDIGTGTGRDALWFARRARTPRSRPSTTAVGAVTRGERAARNNKLSATFEVVNLYDSRAVLALGARLSREEVPVDLYARFTLHALDDRAATTCSGWPRCRCAGAAACSWSSARLADRGRPHVFGEHAAPLPRGPRTSSPRSRRPAAGSCTAPRGRGWHRSRSEDPYVCRIVATWSSDRGV